MNVLYVNSLEANNKELARQLASANVLIAEQNKLAKERQGWALHTNEVIRSLNQQLAAALAACKLKDEAMQDAKYAVEAIDGTSVEAEQIHDRYMAALLIQPDDSALRAWFGEPVAWKDTQARNRIIFPPMKPEEGDDGWIPLYAPKGMTK